MAEIHIINVGNGACIIIRSNSDRITMFDICGGHIKPLHKLLKKAVLAEAPRGNYQMAKYPTNPIYFLKNEMKASTIFRFILSHPDMDHLDGFSVLLNEINIINFWDSGVRREKPDFAKGPYKEDDWDAYAKIINKDTNRTGVTVISPKAGSKNKYFNLDDNDKGGDYLYICSPNNELIKNAIDSQNSNNINDASYVILYRSAGGRILLPGDAHDKTWEFVLNQRNDLTNCEFMVAPHHGRDSSRKWDFLDRIKPKFSVLGIASSKDLAYDAWNRRELEKVTQNQAGNIAVYPSSTGLDIFVENAKFAEEFRGKTDQKDSYGNVYLTHIDKEESE